MILKDLLAHVDQTPAAQGRLDAALRLAGRSGARLTALYLVAEPFMSGTTTHMPDAVIREHLATAGAEADEVLDAIRKKAEQAGVPLIARRLSGPLDRLPALLAQEARSADLAIVGQPDPKTGSGDAALLVEAAFMETGRPALMIPQDGVASVPFRRVLVAWNASREAARAVHDALPLLMSAEDVVVLVVDPDDQSGALERGLLGHLEHHGVSARLKAVESGRRSAGEVIMAEAAAEKADLLVMGGYGHSKLREAMFGGATRTLLAEAALPVLISH